MESLGFKFCELNDDDKVCNKKFVRDIIINI